MELADWELERHRRTPMRITLWSGRKRCDLPNCRRDRSSCHPLWRESPVWFRHCWRASGCRCRDSVLIQNCSFGAASYKCGYSRKRWSRP